MVMHVEPVVLSGSVVRLEPMQPQHAAALIEVGQDDSNWMYMTANPTGSLESMQAWISVTLTEMEHGRELPFVIVQQSTERIVGSTRYMDIRAKDHGLEIGATWLTPEVRRTTMNTECKYLLLCHAFETLKAIRVQLKTDSRNIRSQEAIERLGAMKEGVLRNHIIMPDGQYRHSVYYSVLGQEWPAVKARLEAFLSAQ
ncbi:MAG TPA: GNAT family protein [Ktedonobacteraceae bacterium]